MHSSELSLKSLLCPARAETPFGRPNNITKETTQRAQSEKSPLKSQELRVAPGKLNNKINNRDLP